MTSSYADSRPDLNGVYDYRPGACAAPAVGVSGRVSVSPTQSTHALCLHHTSPCRAQASTEARCSTQARQRHGAVVARRRRPQEAATTPQPHHLWTPPPTVRWACSTSGPAAAGATTTTTWHPTTPLACSTHGGARTPSRLCASRRTSRRTWWWWARCVRVRHVRSRSAGLA